MAADEVGGERAAAQLPRAAEEQAGRRGCRSFGGRCPDGNRSSGALEGPLCGPPPAPRKHKSERSRSDSLPHLQPLLPFAVSRSGCGSLWESPVVSDASMSLLPGHLMLSRDKGILKNVDQSAPKSLEVASRLKSGPAAWRVAVSVTFLIDRLAWLVAGSCGCSLDFGRRRAAGL